MTRSMRQLSMGLVFAGLTIFTSTRLTEACDNNCRERTTFYFCGQGDCRTFEIADCLLCSSKLGLCNPVNTDTRANNQCAQSTNPQTVIVHVHTDCTPVCTCGATTSSVEATPDHLAVQSFQVPHYICDKNRKTSTDPIEE